jgi:D-alanine-D-alanine ligase
MDLAVPRVLVLYSQTDYLIKGQPEDLVAERSPILCAQEVAQALESAGWPFTLVPITGDVETALAPYSPDEWIVFNLGEGLAGRLFEESRIAWALEVMGYRFTGSDAPALSLTSHKARAKALLVRAGLLTPRWRLFAQPAQVDAQALRELTFPLIVKPVAENGSLGIGDDAVAHSTEEVASRVRRLVELYRQAALVEEFVVGREFNVAIWGSPPVVLPISEISFEAGTEPSERVVSFAAKWDAESGVYQNTSVVCPAQIGPALKHSIEKATLSAWHTIGARGYARVDLRTDEKERPLILEVNCNPDLSSDGGFFRSARQAGYSYADMVSQIVHIAMEQTNSYDRSSNAVRP